MSKWNIKKGGSDETTKVLECLPTNLPVSRAQSEPMTKDAMVCNSIIMRDHHIVSSKNNTCMFLASCKDTFKHLFKSKEILLKTWESLLNTTWGANVSRRTTLPTHEKRETRVASTIK